MSEYPFPLTAGHIFGPHVGDIRYHTGRESLRDTRDLARWQRAYSERLDRRGITVNGVFDGDTQRAVINVQRLAGLPLSGCIDAATWDAVWTVQRPPKVNAVAPPLEPNPATVKRTVRGDRKSTYWRRHSKAGVEYGADPDAPPWYPGRPFGPNESGWHVQRVQELIGLNPTGRFTQEVARRVRGVQRMNDLPVSGIVDAATARTIDPGPWDDYAEAS